MSYLMDLNGERCLFTGDLVMGNGLPGWAGDPGYSSDAIAASMRRLLEEDFRHLCYGHGVLRDDRGRLFRRALRNCESGRWGQG
jgi:glyoxylase-like metal-dependent hydrolase (beta-lactamase superfamily II)